ncbi:hypothetical protein A3J78_01040 [Candidatus Beckwithbacteria bacterium RBG_13_35_6]|uniref:Uncharacterized protein n=1 Tax=Candidatus Beckwithbacteria bacterium RBG_13_35_6 TaxID=1797456 RepID=A0A1F5DD33_9BACT|nr:MAG: hypothetical protein A3J78_01040 [Candidatus Beckwithbacteria bacterium RBG_13_35_6]
MSKTNKNKLVKAYSKYRTLKKNKLSVLGFFRDFIPEIIFRTTKLEGEPVTRKMVSRLSK